MTSPSEHVSTVSEYYEAFENVGLYDKKNGNLIKSEIDQQIIDENEKQKDSTLSTNSPKLIDACCNSERANIIDASSSSLSNEDYAKDHTHKDDNMNTEMGEHESDETSIFSGNKCADLEVGQTNDDIRSFIDVILENISLVRYERELVDGDLNLNKREKSGTRSQELCILAGSPEEGQVKTDNNCDIFKTAVHSDEKPENINVRELYFSVKPLITEISNSGEQSEDACFNSEKGRAIDIKIVAIDTEKVDETSQDIESAKFEIKKHENFVDTVKCRCNCFISADRGVKEVNVDTDPEIFNLDEDETNPIYDSISVCNRERSDEASQGSHTLGRKFEEDEKENCNTFEVKATSCLDEILGGFNNLENIEINNFGKQNIEECCSSENGNFNSEDIDIPSKNILIEHGRAEEEFRAANNAECEAQKDETIENNGSSVKKDREVIELHENIYSIVDMNVKKLNLIKMEMVPILDDPNPSIREKMEVVGKKLNELVENLENMEYSVLGLNHGISADIKKIDVEINDSSMQSIDRFCDSEKDNCHSDVNGSLKVITTKDREKMDSNDVADNAISETYENQNIEDNGGYSCSYNGKEVCERNDGLMLCHLQLESCEEKSELKQNNNDSGKSEPVIQESLHESTEKNKTREAIYVTIEGKEDGKHEISMRVLDADKQDVDVFKSSEDDCLNSNVNVKIILTEDHRQEELSETLKHQKSIDCNEKNCLNGEVNEMSDKISPCLDPVVENVNVTERENETVSKGVTVNKREKCKKVSQKFSILRNNIRNEERRKEKTLEVTTLTSKIQTFPEDLDVIVISSTEEENYDDTFNEMSGENDLNTDVLPRDKFHEELDNEIEVLKAQYSDIEKKLSTAKTVSDEEKYKCSLKVKKELTFFMQSLEKLRVSFRNKLLQDKSKISKDQVKPSCSYHVQPQEKLAENPIDKYRYRSQAFTRLTKISHHHYEYNSPMPPWEAVKPSHKCKKRPEDFSASEEETPKNLHKKQCKYSYERAFQQSPEKKNKSCSKRSNCTSYRKARETEFHSYSNELDCFGGRGGFSKSFIAHRELLFSKSNPRNYTNYLSYSNPSPSNPYKNSVSRPCSRKKVSERLYEKGFNLHKYDREHDFKDSLSDSSEISSVSDREFSPIRSDPYFNHGKYCKSKHAKSAKRNDLSPRREKSRKIKEPHEMDEISMSSTDSNSSIEVIEAAEKKRKDKAYKHNIENKRVHNLMDRQMAFIDNYVSKKGDRTESFNDSNVDEKWKQSYYDKEKNKEEMSSSEDTTSVLEKTKKRKKKVYEQPFKQVKMSHHSDLRNILNNKHQNENSKVKFHSHISARSRSMSPVETNIRSPCKLAKTKLHTDGQNIFKNKYNTENSKVKLQSYIVSPATEKKKKNKDIDNYSTHFFGEQTKETKRQKSKAIDSLSTQSLAERNEMKTNRPDDNPIHKMWGNVAQSRRNEACEEQSEGEMNNIKGIESYVSFLKKKKGKYLTPPFTMLINQQLENEREPKYGPHSIDEVKREVKFQKSRTYPENVPVKAKKTVRSPQISPKMAEQSVTRKPVKKEFVENKNDVPAPSGKFDLFKELNRKIRKKKVKPSAPAASTLDADFENQKAFSKPIYPADDDDDASFNKVKEFSTKFEGREYSTKSKDFQEDNGTWSD